jgi:predicted ATPase
MIYSIKITSNDDHLFTIFPNKIFEFNDGINIIFGKNGSGKTLLLNLLSKSVMIEDHAAGISKKPFWFSSEKNINSNIVWDGYKCFKLSDKFLKDEHTNMSYEMTSGKRIPELPSMLKLAMANKSHGEIERIILESITDIQLNCLEPVDGYDTANWNGFIKTFDTTRQSKGTLLFDEVDASMDLETQKWFHSELLPKLSLKFQIICVSHSYYALKHNNIIWLGEKFEI